MTDILCDDQDISTHLPVDKLDPTSSELQPVVQLYQVDVERLIKGYLSGVYAPTTLAVWTGPSATPPWIRAIAARLIASFVYSNRYSEDLEHPNNYAQQLYTEAMDMLECVRIGDVILPTPTPAQGTMFSEDFFQPNTQSTPPKFSMDNVFG
jgi:hypothetical protein